jgi:hypothetical protein
MRKLYSLLFAFIFIANAGMAQFKLTDLTNIGQQILTETVDGVATGNKTLYVHFNSNIKNGSYTATTFFKPNCQTNKGLQIKTYLYKSLDSTKTIDGAFDCNNYGGNRNPGHFASVDSLKNWLNVAYAQTAASASKGDTVKYGYWKPVACLFDKKIGDTTDLVFASYPGMYKRVEYTFYVDLTGSSVKSDFTFDMYTYHQGNTGKTASYQLSVYVGGILATNKVGQVDDIYVTGAPLKKIEVFKAIGMDYTQFSNKKVYIFVKTLGTDSETTASLMDPIVGFDDLRLTYGTAKWNSPAAIANTEYNKGGTGIYTMYTLNGATGTGILKLKGEGRLTTLTVANQAVSYNSQSDNKYEFMDKDGVFANDGNGNYTVPVTYKYTPDTINPTSGSRTSPYITLPAPASGSVNDDILIKFTFTPSQSAEIIERYEINNGVRFWWDVQTMSKDQLASISQVGLNGINAWSSQDMVYVKGNQNPVTLYNVLGQKIGTFKPSVAEGGISVNKGLVFVSTSEGVVKVMVK